MLSIFVIFFREMLEISLIITTILFSINNPNKYKYTLIGVLIGLLCAILLALSINTISNLIYGNGQEIMNAVICFSSAILIGYTVIYMKKNHKNQFKKISDANNLVNQGGSSKYIIISLIALSLIREGSEIVLFSYSILVTNKYSLLSILGEAFAGSLIAVAIGFSYYFGLSRVYTKYIFKMTSWLLIILAANLASQGANFLSSVDVLPEIVSPVWDTSWLIQQNSIVGKILNSICGYVATPSAIQIIFYTMTILLIHASIKIIFKNKN